MKTDPGSASAPSVYVIFFYRAKIRADIVSAEEGSNRPNPKLDCYLFTEGPEGSLATSSVVEIPRVDALRG